MKRRVKKDRVNNKYFFKKVEAKAHHIKYEITAPRLKYQAIVWRLTLRVHFKSHHKKNFVVEKNIDQKNIRRRNIIRVLYFCIKK